MNFPFKSFLQIVTLMVPMAFVLGACGSVVKEVDYKPSPMVPEDVSSTPMKFSGLELLLPPGMNVGSSQGGAFCLSPAYPENRNLIKNAIDTKFLRQTFHDALEANGYDVSGSLDVVFDPDDEEQRAEYAIKGKLKDLQVNLCQSSMGYLDWLTGVPGERGRMYVAIDWSVYDMLRRTVVYRVRSEGYTKRRIPNSEGIALMFDDAFEMAAHNLAADQGFKDLMFHNIKPKKALGGFDWGGEKPDTRPRVFDENEEVTLLGQPLSRQPFAKTAKDGKNVAVMLQKNDQGSGFFITKDGHILTNANIVGDSRRMRVVTASRKTGITAEVLRIDRARDVALLKLEEVPEWLEIETLPIRLDWPEVGEDVYAVGTPKDWKKFRTTVTKGIVSSHRTDMKVDGIRNNYIQGDVEVHPGSSGGPLIDEYGNIVGLSALGYIVGNEDTHSPVGIGLNLFVPIEEALERLDIAY